MEAKSKFVSALTKDIAENRLVFPTLPELAFKIRKVVDDPHITSDKIAKIVATDAALSARLLQVANSVFFKGLNPVENIQTAVMRLGMACVRNVVTSLVMSQLYQAKKTRSIKHELHKSWVHSAKVAAITQVFAKHYTKLNPHEALLAGLIHDIGALPVLSRAAYFPDILEDKPALHQVVHDMHSDIGKLILEDWSFPAELIEVAAMHENLHYDGGADPTFTDVVIIANLHCHIGCTEIKRPDTDWAEIPAFKKLDLTPEKSIAALTEAQSEIRDIQKLLMN